MGWNTWNQFNCNVSESLVRDMAGTEELLWLSDTSLDAMVSNGLVALGYKYLVIDDCWHADERTADGQLQPNPVLFPSGMKKLAGYVNSKGIKLGIYTDIGGKTCQGKPGSLGTLLSY